MLASHRVLLELERLYSIWICTVQVDVNGPNAHPVWRFLLAHQPANHGYPTTIDWNFNK